MLKNILFCWCIPTLQSTPLTFKAVTLQTLLALKRITVLPRARNISVAKLTPPLMGRACTSTQSCISPELPGWIFCSQSCKPDRLFLWFFFVYLSTLGFLPPLFFFLLVWFFFFHHKWNSFKCWISTSLFRKHSWIDMGQHTFLYQAKVSTAVKPVPMYVYLTIRGSVSLYRVDCSSVSRN